MLLRLRGDGSNDGITGYQRIGIVPDLRTAIDRVSRRLSITMIKAERDLPPRRRQTGKGKRSDVIGCLLRRRSDSDETIALSMNATKLRKKLCYFITPTAVI